VELLQTLIGTRSNTLIAYKYFPVGGVEGVQQPYCTKCRVCGVAWTERDCHSRSL